MGSSLRIRARSNRFDETDPNWLTQADELLDALAARGAPVSRQYAAGDGHKGTVTTIVLGLASAGGMTACVEAWKAWLGRDRTRWIELSHTVDGVEVESFVLRGRDLPDGQFDRLAEELTRRLHPPGETTRRLDPPGETTRRLDPPE